MTDTEQFAAQGYIPEIPVLTPEEVQRYRGAFDALEAELGRETTQIGLQGRHFEHAFIWELATHPKILDAVARVYSPDIVLLSTHFFCKYPEPELGRRFVDWHQDVTYWGLQPPKAISAWLAIDDADLENGCMRVIPGSHRGQLEHGKSESAGNLLSINQAIPAALLAVETAVDFCLPAGSMSLHDGLLVHSSNPNRSERRRCGLTLRYSTPEIRLATNEDFKGDWHPILLCGQDRYGRLDYSEPPSFG